MMFPAPASFLGAAAAVLSFPSISNMAEMYCMAGKYQRLSSTALQPTSSFLSKTKEWKSVDEGLAELQGMKRRDLIQLYFECDSDDTIAMLSNVVKRKSYDGYLLDNGPVLSTVTNFITNKLFGSGQKWLGKVYFTSDGKNAIRTGQNRFLCNEGGERLDRTFDCYIDQSALYNKPTSQVIINNYAKHVNKWSPATIIWGGMVDELKVIPTPKCKQKEVMLLGMGYFSWSGGVWNAAPFCLISREN